MHYMYNFFVRSFVVCGLLIPLCVQSFTLTPPSYDECVERSHKIRCKLERERYLRAAALTAAAMYTTYVVWSWFTTEKPQVTTAKASPVEVQKTLPFSERLLEWAKWSGSSLVSLSKLCAQHICVSWIGNKVLHSNAHPHIYIAKHVHYKTHNTEIDRLLTLSSSDETGKEDVLRRDLLLQGHLQALVDKVEVLMAYMLYYGAVQLPEEKQVCVEAYAAETMRTLVRTVDIFNADYVADAQSAITACKKACVEMLTSSIKYAQATLPLDE